MVRLTGNSAAKCCPCTDVLQRAVFQELVPSCDVWAGFSSALTRRSRMLRGQRYATMGNSGMASLSLCDRCNTGWCCFIIFFRVGSDGWYVTTIGTLLLGSSLNRGVRASSRGTSAALLICSWTKVGSYPHLLKWLLVSRDVWINSNEEKVDRSWL